MAGELGKVVVVVGMDTGNVDKAIEEIKKALGETEKKAKDFGETLEKTGKTLTIAGGAITAALTGMVYATIKAGEEINNLSARYGLATEVLSGYKLAAAQNETSLQGLAVGFKFLAKNIDEAKNGNKDSIKAFRELGISLKDTHGKAKPMNDILLDIADRFSAMENNEQKAIIATQIFGKSGNELIPFLNQGRDGLKAAADQAARMGIMFTAEGAAAADELGDSFTALNLATQGLGKSLVQGILPNLTKIVNGLTEGTSSVTAFLNKNQELATVLTSLAGGLGLVATSMGTGLLAITKIGPAFSKMATAAGTSTAALGLAAAGIGLVAGAAFAAYKIYMDYADAVEYAAQAEERFNELSARLEEKLKKAADAAGLSRAEFQKLKEKYDGNIAALAMHIKQGDEGAAMQRSLAQTGKEHAAALEEQAKKQGIVTETMRKATAAAEEAAAKLAALKEELGMTFKSDIVARIKKIEAALVSYKSKLSPESEKALREELTALKIQLGLLKPNIENAESGFSDLEKTMFELAKKIPPEYEDVADDVNATLDSIVANWGKVNEKQKEAGEETTNAWAEVCLQLSKDLSDAFSGMITGTTSFASGIKKIITGLASSVGQAFSNMVTPLLSSLGAMAGPVGSLVGGLVGGILSAFGALIEDSDNTAAAVQERWDKAIKALVADLSYLGTVTETTATLIKNYKNDLLAFSGGLGGTELTQWAAEFVYINELIQDTGLNVYNIGGYWDIANRGIALYEQGAISAADASDTLDSAFASLVQAAQDMGQSGSAAIRDFILYARQAGLEIGSVVEYINEQLGVTPKAAMNAADGLAAMAAGVAPGLTELIEKQKELKEQLATTEVGSEEWVALNNAIAQNQAQIDAWAASSEDDLNRIAGLTLTTFNAMIANGASAADAMNSIGPALDILAEKYTDLGITAPPSIAKLLKIRGVQEAHTELFSAIDGNLAVFQALANTGYMTADALTDVAAQAGDYYNQLTAAGLSSNEALATMAPTLQALHDYAADNGIVLDENTQSLIDQAEAAGLVEDAEMSTADAMLAVGAVIAQAFGQDVPEAMQVALDKMNGVGDSVDDAADAVTNNFGGAVSGVTDGPVADLSDAAKTVADDWKDSAEGVSRGWLSAFGDISDRADDIGDDGTEAGRKWEDAAERARKAWEKVGRGGGGAGDGGGGGNGGDTPEYATGGIAWSPQVASVAENGPEIIMDYGDFLAGDFSDAPARPGTPVSGGGTIVNLSIYAQTLDDNTIRRASEKIYAAIEYEETRRGRRR